MSDTTNFLDFIQSTRPLYVAGGAAYPYSPALEAKFRFTPRFGEAVSLSTRDEAGNLLLPRALCPLSADDRRSAGIKVDYPRSPQPREHQTGLFSAVDDMIEKRQSGVLLAYTGWGKTVLGFRAAYKAAVRTLVITTKEDIFEQWVSGATEFLGIPPERVGRIRADRAEVLEADFCVAMIQSLYRDKYPAWVWEQFGLAIFDEVHRLPAEEFSKVVWKLPCLMRLGITARAKRADGKDLLIDAHVGPVRGRAEGEGLPPKVLRYKSQWRCPGRWVEEPGREPIWKRIPHAPGKTAHIEKMLAKDGERNALIGRIVAEVLKTPRRLVVFATQNEHLNEIHRACLRAGVAGDKMAFYLGGTTKALKAENERAKTVPCVLTNYSKMGEGTNWPWLDTALFAVPRSDVEQPAGRVRREDPEYANKRHPTLIDIVDADSPVFTMYARNRAKWYGRVGAEIVEMN